MAVLGILILILAGLIIWIYNRLVAARQLVDNGWSDIDVQLKRRSDLIPRIVDTVKGFAGHERSLFTEITEKRNQALHADVLSDRAAAENAIKAPLSRLMAVAEDYPDLRANENFLDLQNELSDTENKIEYARRFYNGAVRQMNVLAQSFPVNILAGTFGFGAREYFEMDEPADLPDLDFEA